MKKIFYIFLVSFNLQISLYSQEWFVQNTSVNTSDLHSVNFVDENIGWIVGDNNTILKTTDGGETWITLTAGTEGYRNYSCYFTDSNYGYVVGNSRIRRTTDGGTSWNDIPIASGQQLNSVFFINQKTGWTVGYPGTILKTTDGGINWLSYFSGTDENFESVYFVNDTLGFVAGSGANFSGNSLILKTTNTGEDWLVCSIEYNEPLNSIYFINKSIGYAVGYHHSVFKTTDGGNFWENISSNTMGDWVNSVIFINRDTGWVAGYETDFRKTTDGGLSWTDQSLGIYSLNAILYSIDFINDTIGWVVGNDGKIFKTTDAGTTWISKSSPLTIANLNSIFFIDNKYGWISGEDGTLLHTTNGGTNWVKQLLPSHSNLTSIFFVNKNIGWCSAQTIYKTTDGGESWIYQNTPANVNSMYFIDANTGWAVGYDGMILKTIDGQNWLIKPSGTSYDFYTLHFVNSNIGFVTGKKTIYVPGYGSFSDRKILKTTDGGESWSELNLSTGNSYILPADIYFVDQNTGWACNVGLPLIKTTDGGNSWFELSFNGGKSIYFIDSFTGWIVDGSEKIYKSTDGGITWQNQQSGVISGLNSLYFISDSTGWVVGENGTILSTIQNQIVDTVDTEIPTEFKLLQNYPNPFNPITKINYQIPQTSFVSLKVYDILGREVATIVNEEKPAGSYEVKFDGSDLPSGIYFYKLQSGSYTSAKKMLLIK